MQSLRREIDLDKFSQVLRGSASDDLMVVTRCFVFHSLFCGEPVQLLEIYKHLVLFTLYFVLVAGHCHYVVSRLPPPPPSSDWMQLNDQVESDEPSSPY